MYKNEEVLTFAVDFEKPDISIKAKLKAFDKAPYGIDGLDRKSNGILFSFFNRRCIPNQRCDFQNILLATGCKNSFELSFKGHGLSLSNHYWFKKGNENLKYEDINFFTNKWDDSFARAVLLEDYEALKTADLNVPDIVTPGWGVKGWIYDNGPKLYKIGIDKDHPEEAICEVLASQLARRILSEEEVVNHELKEIGGRYASVSPLMIGIDEELIPLSRVLPPRFYSAYLEEKDKKNYWKKFLKELVESGYSDYYLFFIKLSCVKNLCFVSDLHFDNISIIRNIETGQTRIAPLYDLGGAFGSSKQGRSFLSKPSKTLLLIIFYLFNGTDPDWDYSWYNPDRLIGFEDEIKAMLSKSNFYTPELIDSVIEIYQYQKSSLDEMAKNNNFKKI